MINAIREEAAFDTLTTITIKTFEMITNSTGKSGLTCFRSTIYMNIYKPDDITGNRYHQRPQKLLCKILLRLSETRKACLKTFEMIRVMPYNI
jgi:hypothetical protein